MTFIVRLSIPIVGMVVTTSPSFSLYRMVVFPAASSPTIRILISFFPNRLFSRLPKMFPMVTGWLAGWMAGQTSTHCYRADGQLDVRAQSFPDLVT